MRAICGLSCVLLSLGLQAQTASSFTNAPVRPPQPPIELLHDSHIRQVLSNPSVRVYRIDLEPGEQTAIDRHDHDFLVLSVGSNEFELSNPGGSYPMAMNDGEVQVMKGHWHHRVVNKSKNALHLVEIESMFDVSPERAICGLAAQSCTGAKFAKNDTTDYVESTLFITPSMRLAKVQIEPAAGMPEHGHPGAHLMIALNEQQLTDSVVAGATSEISAREGDATWSGPGIVHHIFNRGKQPARFLTIEWR